MARVEFPVTVGGNGLIVSDDNDPVTGLLDYGWVTLFVPALQQFVAVACWTQVFILENVAEINRLAGTVLDATESIDESIVTANTAAGLATTAATDAALSRDEAASSAAAAAQSASEAAAIASGDIIDDTVPSSNRVFSSEHVTVLFDGIGETVKTIVEESKTGGVYSGPILFDQERDLGSVGASVTVDWSKAHSQRATLTANVQLTFTPPAGVFRGSLKLINGAATARAITWPAGIRYLGGVAPQVPDAKAGAVGIYAVYWDGSTWWVSGGRYS